MPLHMKKCGLATSRGLMLAPSIALADKGFAVSPRLAGASWREDAERLGNFGNGQASYFIAKRHAGQAGTAEKTLTMRAQRRGAS